jgi:hypothetical protein
MTHYKKGDVVFFVDKPMHLNDKANRQGTVDYAFVGEDGNERYVVKYLSDKEVTYRLLGYAGIFDTMDGPSNYSKQLKDPAFCRGIAIRAGIVNEDGTLTPRYSDDPNAYWLRDGVKYYDDDEQ